MGHWTPISVEPKDYDDDDDDSSTLVECDMLPYNSRSFQISIC